MEPMAPMRKLEFGSCMNRNGRSRLWSQCLDLTDEGHGGTIGPTTESKRLSFRRRAQAIESVEVKPFGSYTGPGTLRIKGITALLDMGRHHEHGFSEVHSLTNALKAGRRCISPSTRHGINEAILGEGMKGQPGRGMPVGRNATTIPEKVELHIGMGQMPLDNIVGKTTMKQVAMEIPATARLYFTNLLPQQRRDDQKTVIGPTLRHRAKRKSQETVGPKSSHSSEEPQESGLTTIPLGEAKAGVKEEVLMGHAEQAGSDAIGLATSEEVPQPRRGLQTESKAGK